MQAIDVTYAENNRTVRIRRADPPNLASRAIEVRINGGEWAQTFEMAVDREPADYAHAVTVAAAVYGIRGSAPRCTNSMVYDIWNAMRDIAGC